MLRPDRPARSTISRIRIVRKLFARPDPAFFEVRSSPA